MRATAALVAERRGDHTVYPVLRSAPPLTLRRADGAIWIVGTAAGPLGGDDLHLDVTIGADATVTVRTTAASLLRPGVAGARSRSRVVLDVGARADLRWMPEATVVARGADHRASAHLRLSADATLHWREIVVLGRHLEPPGSLLSRLRVDLDGRPLLRTDLAVGPRWPGWDASSVLGDHRVAGHVLLVGPGRPPEAVVEEQDLRLAVTHLDGPAALVIATGATVGEVRAALSGIVLGPPR